MEHNCIICISDDGYQIVGPFASDEALLSYGRRWQAENGDDPRWQSVYLADPAAPPKHVTPITERSCRHGTMDRPPPSSCHRRECLLLGADARSADCRPVPALIERARMALSDALGCLGPEGYVPVFGKPKTDALREALRLLGARP